MAKKELSLVAVEAAPVDLFRSMLDRFEAEHDVSVNLQVVGWESYRTEFVNIALQQRPVDVSIVGTPITSDLIGMNVLRPFSPDEVFSLGDREAFLPSRWQSSMRPGEPEVWAVPWLLDIRVLYYWRDLLAEAGVDDAAALADPLQVIRTFARLSAAGMAKPWSAPTERYSLLHTVAGWIWASGGDIFSPDGRRVIFHEHAALEGIQSYFSLLKYMTEGDHALGANSLFDQRKAAVTLGNGWMVSQDPPEMLGCAAVPGGSYLGGTDIIVWARTRLESCALELVRFLTQTYATSQVVQQMGLLPLRLNDLARLNDSPSPVHRTLYQAAITGRTFPCVPMIGLVEDRFSAALLQIQHELLADPRIKISDLVKARIVPLANRINISLEK